MSDDPVIATIDYVGKPAFVVYRNGDGYTINKPRHLHPVSRPLIVGNTLYVVMYDNIDTHHIYTLHQCSLDEDEKVLERLVAIQPSDVNAFSSELVDMNDGTLLIVENRSTLYLFNIANRTLTLWDRWDIQDLGSLGITAVTSCEWGLCAVIGGRCAALRHGSLEWTWISRFSVVDSCASIGKFVGYITGDDRVVIYDDSGMVAITPIPPGWGCRAKIVAHPKAMCFRLFVPCRDAVLGYTVRCTGPIEPYSTHNGAPCSPDEQDTDPLSMLEPRLFRDSTITYT